MELSWQMKLRIAAAVATGVVLIGILAWPLAAPSEPLGVVYGSDISLAGKITLVIFAFIAGFIAYFISWPYGREIGILAAPSGLGVWAVRSGNMTALMQLNPTTAQRQAILTTLKWDSIFWLVVVAAGWAGVLLGQKILSKSRPEQMKEESKFSSGKYLNAIIAMIGSVVIVQFFIRRFAQDVEMFDNELGSVMGQPSVGQIIFAVLVSFGIAAFVVKKFLNANHIWPAIACILVTALAIRTYANQELLQYLTEQWPASFFSNVVISILPVQMVAFGTLGSIAGYWMAIRYNYWRKHEIK